MKILYLLLCSICCAASTYAQLCHAPYSYLTLGKKVTAHDTSNLGQFTSFFVRHGSQLYLVTAAHCLYYRVQTDTGIDTKDQNRIAVILKDTVQRRVVPFWINTRMCQHKEKIFDMQTDTDVYVIHISKKLIPPNTEILSIEQFFQRPDSAKNCDSSYSECGYVMDGTPIFAGYTMYHDTASILQIPCIPMNRIYNDHNFEGIRTTLKLCNQFDRGLFSGASGCPVFTLYTSKNNLNSIWPQFFGVNSKFNGGGETFATKPEVVQAKLQQAYSSR